MARFIGGGYEHDGTRYLVVDAFPKPEEAWFDTHGPVVGGCLTGIIFAFVNDRVHGRWDLTLPLLDGSGSIRLSCGRRATLAEIHEWFPHWKAEVVRIYERERSPERGRVRPVTAATIQMAMGRFGTFQEQRTADPEWSPIALGGVRTRGQLVGYKAGLRVQLPSVDGLKSYEFWLGESSREGDVRPLLPKDHPEVEIFTAADPKRAQALAQAVARSAAERELADSPGGYEILTEPVYAPWRSWRFDGGSLR
jgi:hypothetical protein